GSTVGGTRDTRDETTRDDTRRDAERDGTSLRVRVGLSALTVPLREWSGSWQRARAEQSREGRENEPGRTESAESHRTDGSRSWRELCDLAHSCRVRFLPLPLSHCSRR